MAVPLTYKKGHQTVLRVTPACLEERANKKGCSNPLETKQTERKTTRGMFGRPPLGDSRAFQNLLNLSLMPPRGTDHLEEGQREIREEGGIKGQWL